MKHEISDETIEEVEILAKLALNEEEKLQTKKDMEEMLSYFDCLDSLDTTGIEPMTHVLPLQNVFREDVITNVDMHEQMVQNAPEMENGQFKVPVTIIM